MQRPAFSLYDASAGSGKTYALTREYLRIILTAPRDDAYRNILALTFTNKAVHEMKTRIVDTLSAFAGDAPSGKALGMMQEIATATGMTLSGINAKARRIIRHLTHNYAAFDILTIDKFTHRVIRAFAHDLNLPVTFEVSLDTENLLAEAVDGLIAKAGEDEILTTLLVDFTMEKTDDDKSWDVSREIMETGRLILNENNRNELIHFSDKEIPQFMEIREKLREAARCLDEDCVRTAAEAIAKIEAHGIDPKSFSRGDFPNHLGYISRNELKKTHKKYRDPEDIRVNKGAPDRDLIDGLVPELLEMLAGVYRNHEKRDFYLAFLKNLTPLSLLNTVGRELKKIQQEQNVLSIAEFNKLIHDQIQGQPAPFIYERIGERYRHFFIDEFQDTSEMQWLNLIPLIDNATSAEDMSGERGSLMIVGDPKQSIYRWRGGKVEQFITLGKAYNPFNNKDKAIVSLDTNYRSYSEVIRFNNAFFKFLAEEFADPDYRALYAGRSHQKHTEKVGGYVEVSFIESESEDADKREAYARAILEKIQEAQKNGFGLRDIAILTRKRDQGVAVAQYLTQHGVPIISSETLLVANATEVRFMTNLMRYVRNAADLESKAGFLQYLAVNGTTDMPVHDFIHTGVYKTNECEFQSWLSDFGYDAVFSAIRRKSLYDAATVLIAAFVKPQNRNAYLQFFLDIVLEREAKGQAGIADFIDFWDANAEKFSIPSPEGENAVRIMTIHKSKGLEFPVVIFPFAEEHFASKPKDKLWLDADPDVFGLPRILVDNSKAVEDFGEAAASVYQQKKQEELLDIVNVLYVALTRAEEQLYVISAMNRNQNGDLPQNLSSFFIGYLENCGLFDEAKMTYSLGDATRLSPSAAIVAEPIAIEPIARTLKPEAIKIAQRESLMWGTAQQEAIEYGNVVHEILSGIKVLADVDTAITVALESGLIAGLQEREVRDGLLRVIGHRELAGFFDASATILNEQAIIQSEGATLKPDRIVIKPGNEAWILDYKTGAHNQKYTAQLQGYQDALEKMGYRVTKKALVYIGENINVIHL
jgi:ATP-dependent exoDNAse (exonuclease V) beta subunit